MRPARALVQVLKQWTNPINNPKPDSSSPIFYYIAAAVWAIFVFFISTAHISVEAPAIPFLDKLAHLLEYVIMGYLFCRAKIKPGLGIILAVAHGFLCELAQSYIPGREAETMDLLSDIIGVIIGQWLTLFLSKASYITGIK